MIFDWTNKMEGLVTAKSMLDGLKTKPSSCWNRLLEYINRIIEKEIAKGNCEIEVDIENHPLSTELCGMNELTNQWYVDSIKESFKKRGFTLDFEFTQNDYDEYDQFGYNKWSVIFVKLPKSIEDPLKKSLLNRLLEEIDGYILRYSQTGDICCRIKIGSAYNLESVNMSEHMKEMKALRGGARSWYVASIHQSLKDRGFIVETCECISEDDYCVLWIQLNYPEMA